jgi:hypothetical protein
MALRLRVPVVLLFLFSPTTGYLEFSKTRVDESFNQADQVKENKTGEACDVHGRGERSVQRFSGKSRRKEVTRKTEMSMAGRDQNGSSGDWLGDGVVSVGSGKGPVACCCECGDELSGSSATKLVGWLVR